MLVNIANNMGLFFPSRTTSQSPGFGTLDANGESQTVIGKVFLEGGSGSKVLSAAGSGKIHWRTSTVTWANSASRLRVGIQDVLSTGLEDGTFDVYKEYVQGVDALTSNTEMVATMSSGSKTLNHGDLIAISVEMTVRGGTDSVNVSIGNIANIEGLSTSIYPYRTADTGAGPAKAGFNPIIGIIEFDDGTIGWIDYAPHLPGVAAAVTVLSFNVNTGSNDEYGVRFKLPFKCSVRGAAMHLGSIASTDNFEFIIYTDPLGTPVASYTQAIDPNYVGTTSTGQMIINFPSYTLQKNTWYCMAVRPTTANSISIGFFQCGSGKEKFKKTQPFGADIFLVSRLNQTGAFNNQSIDILPSFGLFIDKLDNGVKEHAGTF
jgi:hypothetical protein